MRYGSGAMMLGYLVGMGWGIHPCIARVGEGSNVLVNVQHLMSSEPIHIRLSDGDHFDLDIPEGVYVWEHEGRCRDLFGCTSPGHVLFILPIVDGWDCNEECGCVGDSDVWYWAHPTVRK